MIKITIQAWYCINTRLLWSWTSLGFVCGFALLLKNLPCKSCAVFGLWFYLELSLFLLIPTQELIFPVRFTHTQQQQQQQQKRLYFPIAVTFPPNVSTYHSSKITVIHFYSKERILIRKPIREDLKKPHTHPIHFQSPTLLKSHKSDNIQSDPNQSHPTQSTTNSKKPHNSMHKDRTLQRRRKDIDLPVLARNPILP